MRMPRRACWALASLLAAGGPVGAQERIQPANPVYVDDSPGATDTFARVKDHLGTHNLDEAARILQVLLDEQADRVVRSLGDSDLFQGVRPHVHALLLSTPALLERYRLLIGPRAEQALNDGQAELVERRYLLSPSGLEAALRVAQRQVEGASFEAARLTLLQLANHPDRSGQAAGDAADLLALVARYLNRPDVWQTAQAWARAAHSGATPPIDEHAEPWPTIAARRGLSPLDPAPTSNLTGMLGKPLATVPIGLSEPAPGRDEPEPPRQEHLPPFARELAFLPTVAGDTIYLNDGRAISAWDVFTLSRRWRVVPAGADEPEPVGPDDMPGRTFRKRWAQSLEDPNTVTIWGRIAVAATGFAFDGKREGDARLHAVDAESGRLLWSVSPVALDPTLAQSSFRGPPLVCEGVVIVAARSSVPDRRLMSLYLLGIDVHTGRLLWQRLVGSAGWLPFRPEARVGDAAVVDQGIVYRSDILGVVGAYEAHTGRPLWVRRLPPKQMYGGDDSARAWQLNTPVLDGPFLVILSPDRQRILRLDRATGALVGRGRAADEFGTPTPNYLVRVGGTLAAVSANRIGLVPIDALDTGTIRLAPPGPVPDQGINGRVAAVGDRLLVPVVSGLLSINAAQPASEPERIPLDNPGNVLAFQNQLLVVDDAWVHAYLQWDLTEQILNERMAADPADPAPAVTFAELAYRADKPQRIIGAVDAALKALDAAPARPSAPATRTRLFNALLTMVTASQAPPPPAGAPAGQVPANTTPARSTPRIADATLVAALVERMGRAAAAPDEHAAQILALGRLREAQAQHADAVNTYQRILDDPALAAATWSNSQRSVRAQAEVTHRIEHLVHEHGPAVYAAVQSRAQAEAKALPADATPEQVRALAARYPLASTTPTLWARLADQARAKGHTLLALASMRQAVDAAFRLTNPDAALLGPLAGRLIIELQNQGLRAEAADLLAAVRSRFPQLALSVDGSPIDAGAVAAELSEAQRWPVVGPMQAQGVQSLTGWTLLAPKILDRAAGGKTDRCLVLQGDTEVALWAHPAGSTGELTKVWSRPTDGDLVSLVRTDPGGALLFFSPPNGAVVLERATVDPSKPRWRTAPWPTLFPPDPEPAPAKPNSRQERMRAQAEAMTLQSDLVITMDDHTIVLADRTGRVAGFDAQTGTVLWAARLPMDRVEDIDLLADTLVIAGEQKVAAPIAVGMPAPGAAASPSTKATAPTTRGAGGVALRTEALVVDARTGALRQRINQPIEPYGVVRWVRLTSGGLLLTGQDDAVVCVNLALASSDWVIADWRVRQTRDAWIFGDRLVLLDSDRGAWFGSISSGMLGAEALDAPRGHMDGIKPIDAFRVSPTTLAIGTYQGVLLYGPDGALLGVDAVGSFDGLLPPQPAQGQLVTIETIAGGRRADGLMVYTIHTLDTVSARLLASDPIVLGAPPAGLHLIDGGIAITAGPNTIFVQAPAVTP